MNPRIAIIVGSTRDTRFADKPAGWIRQVASERDDIDVEVLDLRDFEMPLFNEVASNLWAPTQNAAALRWQETLAGFDGFVFVTAEYNRSLPASLKNALDHAYVEWNRKPAAIVSYGAAGGTRAAEHLRTILIELQMVPVRAGVHIGGPEFLKVHPMGENADMDDLAPALAGRAKDMLDELAWWARVTKQARAEETANRQAA